MGFVVERDVYKLVFKDPKYAGLEVSASELSTGELWEFLDAEKIAAQGGAEGKAARLRTVEIFVSALVSWNATDKQGQPTPMTVEGVLSLGHRFNSCVMDAWTDALVGISAPLSPTSSDGLPSLEASIPMDVPSASLAS